MCKSKTSLHKFPCNDLFCFDCLGAYIENCLKRFEFILNNNFEALNGKFSFFCCLNQCEVSKLSMSPADVEGVIRKSKRIVDKENLFRILNIGKHFFFGISSFFGVCVQCKSFFSYLGNFCIICESCIANLTREKLGALPISTFVISCITYEEYKMNEEMFGENVFFIDYNQEINSYTIDQVLDGFLIKLSKLDCKEKNVLISRVVAQETEEIDTIKINDFNVDLEVICRVKLQF